jgi:hypothetical protein
MITQLRVRPLPFILNRMPIHRCKSKLPKIEPPILWTGGPMIRLFLDNIVNSGFNPAVILPAGLRLIAVNRLGHAVAFGRQT